MPTEPRQESLQSTTFEGVITVLLLGLPLLKTRISSGTLQITRNPFKGISTVNMKAPRVVVLFGPLGLKPLSTNPEPSILQPKTLIVTLVETSKRALKGTLIETFWSQAL